MNPMQRSTATTAACLPALAFLGMALAGSAPADQNAFVATVNTGGLTTVRVRPCLCLDPAMANSDTCYTSTSPRQSWDGTGAVVPCDFDVVYGSSPGGMTDARGTYRDPGALDIASTSTDGNILSVKSGYAVASGKFPLLAGIRVRGASDGTQFAIEVTKAKDAANVEHITERIYFITSIAQKPVKVRVYRDDNQTTEETASFVELAAPGDFCEVTWDRTMIKMPVPTLDKRVQTNSPQREEFFAQMYLLNMCGTIPREPECKTISKPPAVRQQAQAIAAASLKPVVYDTYLTRFIGKFHDKDGKPTIDTITTITPTVPPLPDRKDAPQK